MTESANPDITEKPRSRRTRFALYAVILLALLAWMHHENSVNDAIKAQETAVRLKRQQQINVEQRRIEAAYALATKAESANDAVEQVRVYDEIIDTYKDDNTAYMVRLVSWAMCRKLLTIIEPIEKTNLFKELVDRYCDEPDKQVNSYVMLALRAMLNQTESEADKAAFCNNILETHGHRLTDSLTAWLLEMKITATPYPAEQIAICDTILSRFLTSKEDSAFSSALQAAVIKMTLITDKDEQIRLCDIVIGAYLKAPQGVHDYLFEIAINTKTKLVDNPKLPLELYNQVITDNNMSEEAVAQARSNRLRLLKNDEERLAACDEIIAAHQSSADDFIQLMVVRAMIEKSSLLADPEIKATLFLSIVEKTNNIKDPRTKARADQYVIALAERGGETDFVTKHYDTKIAGAKNELEAIRALRSKAHQLESTAEKIRIYDEIIARGSGNQEPLVSTEVTNAIMKKTKLVNDKEEKIKLYNEIISRGMGNSAKEVLIKTVKAMYEKAKLIDNQEEKIKLYDTILFDMGHIHAHLYSPNIFAIFHERVDLATEAPEKVGLYDRFINANGDAIEPKKRRSLILDKASFVSAPADKLQLYNEVIESCELILNAEQSDDNANFVTDSSVLYDFSRAIQGKADLSDNTEEKLKLYDRYIYFAEMDKYSYADIDLGIILTRKAELLGDPSVKNGYFDEKIRSAATDLERVKWYSSKALFAEETDKAAIEDEIIAIFFDNTAPDIEMFAVWTFFNKIEKTLDLAERDILCDRLIKRYQDSVDHYVLNIVARTFILKAEVAKEDGAKIEIYSTVIERYQNKASRDGSFLKKSVDEAIAAKEKLEIKIKNGE